MNERIEHCLYQSGLTAQGCWDELDDYAKQGIEKFAELLVKECADIAFKSGSVHNKSIEAVCEADRIYHKIRDQFGD